MSKPTFLGRSLRELHHSKRSNIYYVKLYADDWRHVNVREDGSTATVGPIYKSRSELLADSYRYCHENWGIE